MTTLVLQILAKDILETDYTVCNDCAITRALVRAGRPDLIDYADCIIDKETDRIIVPRDNEGYQKMASVVYNMYWSKKGYAPNLGLPIEDKEFTLTF